MGGLLTPSAMLVRGPAWVIGIIVGFGGAATVIDNANNTGLTVGPTIMTTGPCNDQVPKCSKEVPMNIKRILCCVDFSSNADKAFETALDLTRKYDAQLHLLHVLPPVISPLITDIDLVVPAESSTVLVEKLADQMIHTYGQRIPSSTDHVLRVREGHVSSEILHYLEVEEIDLVIVGAYGLSGMELVLFGSVAKRIAHKAGCSVMIVRHADTA